MAKYILNSTRFYDIVTVLKNIYSYIKPYPENGKIVYKRNPECKMIVFSVLYFVFLMPLFLILKYYNTLIQDPKYLIAAIIITIPFTIVAIFYFGFETGNIKQTMQIMKKQEE
jgi:pilus assembly protein TadC